MNDPNSNDNACIFMPNAFSPNGDNLNDTLRPICTGISSIEFTVYDNNGNTLFTASQTGQGWNPGSSAGYGKFY